MKFKVTGIDAVQRRFKEMARAAEELNGEHQVSLDDLFSEEFMNNNTRYDSLDDFFDAAGFKIESQQDFDDLPEDELDAKVQELTKYQSWDDFKHEAIAHYTFSKLGF